MKDWRRVCPEAGHQSMGKSAITAAAASASPAQTPGRIPLSFGRPFRFQVAVFFSSSFRVSDATRLESIKIYRCRLFFFCLSTISNRFNYY